LTRRTERKLQQRQSRIPEFHSYEEEAAWFDTHDMADYQDEFKPAEITVDENLVHSIVIDLDRETMRRLDQSAREQGLSPIALARAWILERLEDSAQPSPGSG
jgi:hypothetical protein